MRFGPPRFSRIAGPPKRERERRMQRSALVFPTSLLTLCALGERASLRMLRKSRLDAEGRLERDATIASIRIWPRLPRDHLCARPLELRHERRLGRLRIRISKILREAAVEGDLQAIADEADGEQRQHDQQARRRE